MKIATIAVILGTRSRKLLGVHRKGRPNDWGFPGGKVGENEDHCVALKRELLEETGYQVVNDLTYYGATSDGDYLVHIYFGKSCDVKYVTDDNEGLGKWIDFVTLLDVTNEFYNFNQNLLFDLVITGINTCIEEVTENE